MPAIFLLAVSAVSSLSATKSRFGAGRAGWTHDAHRRLALLAVALLGAVVAKSGSCSRPFAARRTHQQHVRKLDRHLLRQPPPLRIPLAAADMPVDPIDPLHHPLPPPPHHFSHPSLQP